MRKNMALLLTAVLVTGIFSGCKAQEPAIKGPDQTKLAAEQILRLSFNQDVRSLDPQSSVDEYGTKIIFNCFDGLVKYDKDGQIMPALAREWRISQDYTQYTFYLRDAKWSDGTPITAEDFVYSWTRAILPETKSPNSFKFFVINNAEQISKGTITDLSQLGLKVIDSQTFQVTLAKPTPYFMSLLVDQAYCPAQKAQTEALKEQFAQGPDSLIVSGPFLLDAWDRGKSIRLKKNPDYYDADKVTLQEVVYTIVADEPTRLSLYEKGELDSLSFDTPLPVQHEGSPELKRVLLNGLFYVSFNCKDPYFSNVNLRKALSMTMNRDRFAHEMMKDNAKALRGFVPYTFPGTSDGNEFREINGDLIKDISTEGDAVAAEAKALLDKGLAELGKTRQDLSAHMTFIACEPSSLKLAEMLKEDWKRILEIDLQIESINLSAGIDRMFSGDYSLLSIGYSSAYIDANSYLEMYTSNFVPSTAYWKNTSFDKAIQDASQSAGNERIQHLLVAEKIFMEELPVAPVYQRIRAYLDKPYVRGMLRSGPQTADYLAGVKLMEH